MYDDQTISIIIPALNEESSLPHVLDALPRWVDDVVVVDNGSTDQTATVAVRHGARVVPQPERGYGAACLAGIAAAAEAEILAFVDADFSDHPEQLDRLVGPIARGEADLVIGSRTRGRRERGALTPQQRWGNALACWLIRRFWGHAYTDLGPFRAVQASALDCLRMDDRTYGWTVQMQIRAVRAGLRIEEAPVDYRRRIGRSKISGTVRGVVRAGTRILSTVFHERHVRPPVSSYRVRSDHLIVFTRLPEPGRTKTRLISALGATGAADLQQAMTGQTLLMTERFQFTRGGSTEVRFAGGDSRRIAEQFGQHHVYLGQRGADLGERMCRALDEAFARGCQRAVIIGTDCPALDESQLSAAFDALENDDCVIGPAHDGGYYLIGARTGCRPLFEGVTWGSADVLDQTLRRAATAGLSVSRLATLQDVDEPGDLPVFERHRTPRFSVIIPALNEAPLIARAIDSAAANDDVEILVVDGGSKDRTPQVARAAGARVIHASTGRARQMNAGAAAARGSILVFLHADTRLPRGYAESLKRLTDSPDAGGDRRRPACSLAAFRLRIDHPRRAFRWVERYANVRSCYLGLPYGDQAMAIPASVFYRLGGFGAMPILEDLDLARRARRVGRVRIARLAAETSPRRWLASGVLRLSLVHHACIAAALLGVRPERLAQWRAPSKTDSESEQRPVSSADRPNA